MLLLDYAYWHYGVAPSRILKLLRNYLIATWHRFLIGTHARTLFAPWHRARPSDVGRPQTFGEKIGNAVVDFYIRIVAAIIRLVIIIFGLLTEALLAVAFILLLAIWLLWPAILFVFITNGLSIVLGG